MPDKAKYFGVIGNRDHIKIQGEKVPFWHFLDEQPDGWLCSLAYYRKDVPQDRPMIWDCGAWSYKMDDSPKLGKIFVTPEWTFQQYMESAKPGDMIVAPDHMLVSDEVSDVRMRLNREYAKRFFDVASGSAFHPMAVIHGRNISERIDYARDLQQMGYRHLSIGGIAFRASSRKSEIFTIVQSICKYCDPEVWIHVLGLSAPTFAEKWTELGVTSFDGASHFKQAFTAGKFYIVVDGNLIGLPASKDKNEPPDYIPECNCSACSVLRQDGVDTRTYGSNENNMGRAAHNLNMLMRVLRCVL